MNEKILTMKFINAYWDKDLITSMYTEDGKMYTETFTASHCFYIKKAECTKELAFLRKDNRCISIRNENEWVKVSFKFERTPEYTPYHVKIAKYIEDNLKIKTYEADVHPVRRWIIDNDVEIDKPRRCYIDLETDSRVPFRSKTEARILCWVIVGEGDGSEVCASVLTEETDEAENNLLTAMWKCLDKYDQVCAWNGDRFDFEMIKARSKHVGIDVDVRRWLWLDHLVLYKKMNTTASSGEEKQSLALDAVAKSLLGEGKTEGVSGTMSYQLWSDGFEGKAKLLNYCQQDTDLMRRIEAKTGYIELFQTIAEATKVFPDSQGLNSSQQVESFILNLAKKKDLHFSSHFRVGSVDKYEGAYVMQPTTKGIISNCHVADFASLYPSIIITWNMSPETYVGGAVVGERKDICVAPRTNIGFLNEPKGIVPEVVEEFIRLRKEWNDKKSSLPPGTPEWEDANRKSTAYKIVANSVYGTIGMVYSRFYLRDLAESVSQSGVWLIQKTIDAARDRGYDVIYGDTDSIFVVGPTKEEFEAFTESLNKDLYPILLKQQGCIHNKIKIAYEKQFDRLIFVSAKKYTGRYLHYKGTFATEYSKPEIRGLEYKRGDTSRLTRDLQFEVITKLMSGKTCPIAKEFEQILNSWKYRILEDNLELKDFTIAKKLGASLKDTQRRTKKDGSFMKEPAHIEVARLLESRGLEVGEGTKVAYVVVDASTSNIKVVPISDFTGEFDRFYLWENLVYPATYRLLESAFPDFNWKQWCKVRPRVNINQLSLL